MRHLLSALSLIALTVTGCSPEPPPAGQARSPEARVSPSGPASPLQARGGQIVACPRGDIALRFRQRGEMAAELRLHVLDEGSVALAKSSRSFVVYHDTSAICFIGPEPGRLAIDCGPEGWTAGWVAGKEHLLLSETYRADKTLTRHELDAATLKTAIGMTDAAIRRVTGCVRFEARLPGGGDAPPADAPELVPDRLASAAPLTHTLYLWRTRSRIYLVALRNGGIGQLTLQHHRDGPVTPTLQIADPDNRGIRW